MNPGSILNLLEDLRICSGFTSSQALIEDFFRKTDADTVAAAVLVLSGISPPRVFGRRELQSAILQTIDFSDWLMKACKEHTGNLTEVLSLIGVGMEHQDPLASEALCAWFVSFCNGNLATFENESLKESLLKSVLSVSCPLTRRTLLAMLCGEAMRHPPIAALRGALRSVFSIAPLHFAWMLRESGRRDGHWLAHGTHSLGEPKNEFPFSQLTKATDIGSISKQQVDTWVEPCYRGCHCQLHIGKQGTMLWSKNLEDLTAVFPEISDSVASWKVQELVLEGILTPETQNPLGPTAALNARSQSSNPKKQVASNPMMFKVFDLLQYQGKDLRMKPRSQRRAILEALLSATPSYPFQIVPGWSAHDWFDLKTSPITINHPLHRGWVFNYSQTLPGKDNTPSIGFLLESPPLFVIAALTAIRFPPSSHGDSDRASCTFALRSHEGWLPVAHIDPFLPGAIREKIDSLITSHYGHTHTLSPGLLARISYREVIPNLRSKAGCSLHGVSIAEWILDGQPAHASSVDTLRIPQAPAPPSVSSPTYSPQLLLFDE